MGNTNSLPRGFALVLVLLLALDAQSGDAQREASPVEAPQQQLDPIQASAATQRQTPKTDFGSMVKGGANRAAVDLESLRSATRALRRTAQDEAAENAAVIGALREQVRIAELRGPEYTQLIDDLYESERELTRLMSGADSEDDEPANPDLQEDLQRQQRRLEALSRRLRSQQDALNSSSQNLQ
jgi:hypothetical protein